VQTTLPFGKYVMEHDALDLEILILILSKVLQCGITQKEMEQDEIAALIALQRYFEDQK
jgi:hypothetical protein